MNEFIKRVARAISATRGPKENWSRATQATRDLWLADARAAIAAIREPSEAMCLATEAVYDAMPESEVVRRHSALSNADIWRAMVDVALQDDPQ